MNFHHLLEGHDLCGAVLGAVNHYLEDHGNRIGTGTFMDATIIHAPSSTKNPTGTRDPEMHQARKGNQWLFGILKCLFGFVKVRFRGLKKNHHHLCAALALVNLY